MTIDWKHTRDMREAAQDMRKMFPPQNSVERVSAVLHTAIGQVFVYGGAAIADIASAVTKRISGKQ
ncbi:MAG TPA: hypothetical protein DEB30_05830 [Candidatus Peribacter riflensis]|nr:MAG: hypothetical protein A2412_03575 [Candidatus Peribacteria bacterium RIFOXYC1_FULL_58_8]OGJ78334.1 MAG: hypothetical protein A2398_05665 [Candidatus Peribacteria bacterium RIFOXYB1_FULL_57_12]HBH19570.1 hypothetical protein [Candidatus Peribacter riflensis]HBU10280.1 hypothetical protein [Candidatus Peribacter riflensis]